MKSYFRIILGKKNAHAQACFEGNFIGVDFGIEQDLTNKLVDEWRAFNREFIPVYLNARPDKTRIAAGLACGFLWTVARALSVGDIVRCPDGSGHYRVGEVAGGYEYKPSGPLPHRRPVRWLGVSVERSNMSESLRNSTGSIGTVTNITKYHDEVEKLIAGGSAPATAPDVASADPAAFVMEKHLEDFLVANWAQTELARDFDIYELDGERVGQQFLTDTGPLDILALSKDKKTLLVVELKKGRASDVVVGQTLRYMGYVKEELAEENQIVKGLIIALDDDQRIRRALAMVKDISFYRYEVTFKLVRS